MCAHHLHTAPVPPSRRGAGVDPTLEAILLQCLEKDRELRPQSAHALGERLTAARAAMGLDAGAIRAWWEQIRSRPPGPSSGAASSAGARSPHGTTVLNIDLHAR